MTAFGLVMLGKLVFLVVFVCFFAVVASLRLYHILERRMVALAERRRHK